MGLSETILAAMIGAFATVMTAVFQLFLAFRARIKSEGRGPKRSAVRSLVSVFAIILASMVAGYGYAELRAERAREDTRSLREELAQQRAALGTYTAQLEQLRTLPRDVEGMITLAAARSTLAAGTAEAMVQLAACAAQPPAFGNTPVPCAERDAQKVALCAIVPARAAVQEVQLFARGVESNAAWEQSRVAFEQDAGGLRFSGAPFELARDAQSKAVCANVAQWNAERAHAVRLVVLYAPNLNPTVGVSAAP
jgi:hypothetical protein